ncbi:hypothetical protein KJ695_01535 [Patescibacteria group bacterium]|nr:hypothetical protein [Patescibacteria group bacterium]MBU4056573.1 hypothetical protein [Patescibacteria group bacterium]MBU4368387.1 hypothetical protein [Patescibacteria group bacterium]
MIDFNSKKPEIEKLAEKYKIKFIVSFGSRAKGVPKDYHQYCQYILDFLEKKEK